MRLTQIIHPSLFLYPVMGSRGTQITVLIHSQSCYKPKKISRIPVLKKHPARIEDRGKRSSRGSEPDTRHSLKGCQGFALAPSLDDAQCRETEQRGNVKVIEKSRWETVLLFHFLNNCNCQSLPETINLNYLSAQLRWKHLFYKYSSVFLRSCSFFVIITKKLYDIFEFRIAFL